MVEHICVFVCVIILCDYAHPGVWLCVDRLLGTTQWTRTCHQNMKCYQVVGLLVQVSYERL